MRLRILASVVAVLAGALLLAGVLSYSLVRDAELSSARVDALREATAVAKNPSVVGESGVFPLLGATTQGRFGVVEVAADGSYLGAGPPSPIPHRLSDGRRLQQGHPISGVVGQTAYAIAPMRTISSTALGGGALAVTLAIADERPVTDAFASIEYFLLAGGISLIVAGLVTGVIAQRISRRVVAASAAARQIASGDLDVRVERGGPSYPELGGLADAMDTMAANLARARDQERQFLLSISHDLRTPLTSIRGYAEAIRDGAVADATSAAAVLVAEATRLDRLIRDLLDLARLQARQFSLNADDCDLAAVVGDAVEAQRLAHEAVDVELAVTLPDHPVRVVTDADRVAQVVANLVDNALKFARSIVRVDVAEVTGGGVVLSVENDGPAIPAEYLDRVFERHFTTARSAARAGGSGLGLAIVAELVAAMGGTRRVDSPVRDGVGTRFVLELPLSATTGDSATGDSAPGDSAPAAHASERPAAADTAAAAVARPPAR